MKEYIDGCFQRTMLQLTEIYDFLREEISNILSHSEKRKYFEFNNDKYDVVIGDKYYIINNKKQSLINIYL